MPPQEVDLLHVHPLLPGAQHVCVALYEYKDLEHSSEAWCAPGFRVDVLEETNEDWYKVRRSLLVFLLVEMSVF